jgi:hypothetical protein
MRFALRSRCLPGAGVAEAIRPRRMILGILDTRMGRDCRRPKSQEVAPDGCRFPDLAACLGGLEPGGVSAAALGADRGWSRLVEAPWEE